LALWDEAARWGDYRKDVHPYQSQGTLYKPDGAYATERQRLLKQYFPVRTDNVIQQLRSKGWFPNAEAPAIFIDDTEIGYGLQPYCTESTLTMSGQNIYYTLDGSAPVNWFNNDAGALSPTAIPYNEGDNLQYKMALLTPPDTITMKAISRVDGEWSPIVTVRLAVDSPTDLSPAFSKEVEMVNGKWLDGKCFDLLGRRITARELRQGIFVVNGKKVMVRK
jgi:hypothetical protein